MSEPTAVPGYTGPVPPGAGGPPPVPEAAGVPVAGRLVLAGWWRRVGAQVVDGVIVAAGALLLLFLVTAPFSGGALSGDDTDIAGLIVVLLLGIVCVTVVALLYAPALMARTDGRTVGRMATGIRVVRNDGQPITFRFAMVREVLVKSLLFSIAGSLTGGIAYLLDVLWPLWDEENRALHDFLVSTRVVRS